MSYLRSKLLPLPESETILEPWRKALLDAADTLRRDGWCIVYKTAEDGKHCIVGAIEKATNDLSIEFEAMRRLKGFLAITSDHHPATDLMLWNDEYQNSGERVIAALTDCARS